MVNGEHAMNMDNETQNPMLPFAGEAAFQKAAWAVGKIYVVRCILAPTSPASHLSSHVAFAR